METSSAKTIVTVSETAADALHLSTDEIPPLWNAIDPDALATLVSRPDVTVTFQYAGLDLVVHSGDTVYAQPIVENWDKRKSWTKSYDS